MVTSGSVEATCLVCQEKAEVRAEAFLRGQASITCMLCGTALIVKPDGTAQLAVHSAARPKSVPPPSVAPGAAPSVAPGVAPSAAPGVAPSVAPGVAPSVAPGVAAGAAATTGTADPTLPTGSSQLAAVDAGAAAEPAPPSITETARAARAFEGGLENVAVPDVVQLICQSRKTGILTLAGEADGKFGSGKLVFSEGQIVGCEHPSRAFQIGRILVHMKVVTEEQIDAAASLQQVAGKDRKPLVATLVDQKVIDEVTGHKALEKLVQTTIVEAMLWETGTFSFAVAEISPADSFRHVPDGMAEALGVDAQNALMEAVRIIDEGNHPDETPGNDGDVDLEFDLAAAEPTTVAATEPTAVDGRVPGARRSTGDGLEARLRRMARSLPRPPEFLVGPRVRWVGIGVGLFGLVVIVLFFALGGDDSVPVDATSLGDSVATTAADALADPDPDESTAEEAELGARAAHKATRPERNRTKRAPTTSTRDHKRKAKRKQRAKRKRKANDAGSFFDAALQSDP